MRHLKLFELFSIKAAYTYEEEETNEPDKYVVYSFRTDNYLYDVIFEKFEDGWQAEHKIGNPFTYDKLKLTSDNVFKITSTVMYITRKFIKEKKPNYLVILYMSAPDEIEDPTRLDPALDKTNGLANKMNKRARLQLNYLKQMRGYTPKYYYRSHPHHGRLETCCLFYRNGYDISDIENKILTKFQFKILP